MKLRWTERAAGDLETIRQQPLFERADLGDLLLKGRRLGCRVLAGEVPADVGRRLSFLGLLFLHPGDRLFQVGDRGVLGAHENGVGQEGLAPGIHHGIERIFGGFHKRDLAGFGIDEVQGDQHA